MFEDEEELPSIIDIDNYFSQSENYRNELLGTYYKLYKTFLDLNLF